MNHRNERGEDSHEPPTDDPNAMSDAPACIAADVDPNDEQHEAVEESAKRAAWRNEGVA